jgi:hypothetical protein
MQPNINDYKILYLHQTYFVLNPYDLFTMPALKIVGFGHRKIEQAQDYIFNLYTSHLREYDRLMKLGRSFPDND